MVMFASGVPVVVDGYAAGVDVVTAGAGLDCGFGFDFAFGVVVCGVGCGAATMLASDTTAAVGVSFTAAGLGFLCEICAAGLSAVRYPKISIPKRQATAKPILVTAIAG
jgi:hypothetical protein